jgi:ribosome-binding protein aMBF1 (putative translation factor)
VQSLVEQVKRAQAERGWSVQRLLTESGLRLERSSLQRKLSGYVHVTTDECEALARALEITLVWPKRGRRRTA